MVPLLPQLCVQAYTGRLNSASKHLVERWDAGDRYPAAAADDSQAHSIVKVCVCGGGGGRVMMPCVPCALCSASLVCSAYVHAVSVWVWPTRLGPALPAHL